VHTCYDRHGGELVHNAERGLMDRARLEGHRFRANSDFMSRILATVFFLFHLHVSTTLEIIAVSSVLTNSMLLRFADDVGDCRKPATPTSARSNRSSKICLCSPLPSKNPHNKRSNIIKEIVRDFENTRSSYKSFNKAPGLQTSALRDPHSFTRDVFSTIFTRAFSSVQQVFYSLAPYPEL